MEVQNDQFKAAFAKTPQRVVVRDRIVLKTVPDDRTALGTIVLDAEDFHVTGRASAKTLVRSIQFAIQRQHYLAAATRYLCELETFEELAPAVEHVGNAMETVALTGASSEPSDHELKHRVNVALRDDKAQLQVVVNAFLLLDLLWRNRLAAEGIHICGTPIIAPSDGMRDQLSYTSDIMRVYKPRLATTEPGQSTTRPPA